MTRLAVSLNGARRRPTRPRSSWIILHSSPRAAPAARRW